MDLFMNLSKSFLAGAALSFFGLLLLAEVFLRLTVPTGFWYRHFDVSGDMTSLAELKDRLRDESQAALDERPILLLGDSVLGASALLEHRLSEARIKTLSQFLRAQLQTEHVNCISLGSDGLLLPDIEGLTTEFLLHPPERVILFLNFRMFAKDFAEGPKAISRNFLLSDLPLDIQKRLAPDVPPSKESKLSDQLYTEMCKHWFLFRETQMLKTRLYYPSQKDFFQRLLERVVGRNETQVEIAEAALKQKIASYYQAYLWDKHRLPLESLRRVLDEWAERRVRVNVFLVPQNQKFMGNYLDKPSFEKNRKTLAAFLKPYNKKGIHYDDWADQYPPAYFLDHCHLTPEGNEQFAKDIIKAIEPWK